MKKMLLFVCTFLMLTAMSAALADPAISANGYTAYLGEDNYLFLRNPQGTTKVLRFPMANVNAVTATHVYATALDGTLMAITIDGSQTAILTGMPLDVQAAPLFEVSEGNLYTGSGDMRTLLATGVTIADANSTQLYFQQQDANGAAMVKAISLNSLHQANPAVVTIGVGSAGAIAMTATDDAIVLVCGDRTLKVITPKDGMAQRHGALSDKTAQAISVDGKIYRFTSDVENVWLLEGGSSALMMVDVTPAPTPTATPFIPTLAPTATPRVDLDDDGYETLRYGDSGSAVRKMQRRLKDLGYPVGKVDGVWGPDTQLAVNLFQHFVKHKERSYIVSATLEKLYSGSAPKYDRCKPLKQGDSGTPVLLMQQALFNLGYFGADYGEVDGHYGPKTVAAVKALQQAIVDSVEHFDTSITPTGKADRATLKVLFGTMAPMAPDRPSVTEPPLVEVITPPMANQPTDGPVDEITPPLVEEITPPPSDEPTDEPTNAPVDEITPPLVEEITPPPSDEPDPEPTDDGGVDLIVPGN